MDYTLIGAFVIIAIAIFLFEWGMLRSVYAPARRDSDLIKDRIKKLKEVTKSDVPDSLIKDSYREKNSSFYQNATQYPGVALITLWIEQSGQTIKLQNFLGAMVAISIGSFVAVLIGTHNLLYAGIGAFVGFFLPVIHLAKKKHDRLANFDDHLTDAMDIMIRALKAGHPFNTSLQLVSEELKGPISEEMAITFAELNFGESTQTALTNLIRRVPSKLLKSVVTAILLQRETGGNLAEILEKINKVVRDSHRFQRNLKTLAAEGKMSAIVLASVPVVLGIGMYFIQPDVMAELFINPTGHTLLKISAVLYTIGFFWIRILIKIDV